MRTVFEVYFAINLIMGCYALFRDFDYEEAEFWRKVLFLFAATLFAMPLLLLFKLWYAIAELQIGNWCSLIFTKKWNSLTEEQLYKLNKTLNHSEPETFRQRMNARIITIINKRNNYEFKRGKESEV